MKTKIDNYEQAEILVEKMKAMLPIKIFPTQRLSKQLDIPNEQEMMATDVLYGMDEGGILCVIELNDNALGMVSLTHVKIDPSHPLAEEITDYQQTRVHRLRLQDQRSFMSEMLSQKRSPKTAKKRKKKGF
jgi:hypothetical protein